MVVGSSASTVATIRRESIAGAGIETSVLSFLLVSREGSRATFLRDGKSVERNTWQTRLATIIFIYSLDEMYKSVW